MAGRFFAAIVLVLLAGVAASAPVLAETGRAAYYRGGRTASGEVTGRNGYPPAMTTPAHSGADTRQQWMMNADLGTSQAAEILYPALCDDKTKCR